MENITRQAENYWLRIDNNSINTYAAFDFEIYRFTERSSYGDPNVGPKGKMLCRRILVATFGIRGKGLFLLSQLVARPVYKCMISDANTVIH